MRSKFGFAVMGVALLFLCTDPASAGRRSFSVDPYGARTQSSASRELATGGLSGIMLPEGGGGSEFGIGIVIPKPYKRNSPIRIIFNWQTPGTNCDIRLEESPSST